MNFKKTTVEIVTIEAFYKAKLFYIEYICNLIFKIIFQL